MMKLLEITIKDEGEHWSKEIRLFGLLIYSRHDYAKETRRPNIGFTVYPSESVFIEQDEEFYPEEFKKI